ncbi:hypothetical protein LTR84_005364 [Exophiala bonariae]|uniref:Uncharacterized protein n=1 Tax=Exophiala bonariae TaxID=1690606 RepID=A0AAV9N4T1_9EURO|nr:hypothetical protein LTR84_005364 [Exophiala bonariae]
MPLFENVDQTSTPLFPNLTDIDNGFSYMTSEEGDSLPDFTLLQGYSPDNMYYTDNAANLSSYRPPPMATLDLQTSNFLSCDNVDSAMLHTVNDLDANLLVERPPLAYQCPYSSYTDNSIAKGYDQINVDDFNPPYDPWSFLQANPPWLDYYYYFPYSGPLESSFTNPDDPGLFPTMMVNFPPSDPAVDYSLGNVMEEADVTLASHAIWVT